MPDANWGDARHVALSDDVGVSEWRLTATLLDGGRIDVLGCDFLTVRDGKIVRKNSFRKQSEPQELYVVDAVVGGLVHDE